MKDKLCFNESNTVLIIGCTGAIGQQLAREITHRYGPNTVIAALHRSPLPDDLKDKVVSEFDFDIKDIDSIRSLFQKHKSTIKCVWNLAAPLSLDIEKDPENAKDIAVGGMQRVLTAMAENGIKTICFSDSIGSFGSAAPRDAASVSWLLDNEEHDPGSDYGLQKRECRFLLQAFAEQHGFDTRFAVIPGVLHAHSEWGGGTTEYALDAIAAAFRKESYECPVAEDTELPMIHVDDLMDGLIKLMSTPRSALPPNFRGVPLAGFSFAPKALFAEIKQYFPEFSYSYNLEANPAAARFSETWPNSLDSEEARVAISFVASHTLSDTVKYIVDAHKSRGDFEK